MDQKATPRAAKKPVEEHCHGRVRVDEYAWLRAKNWQEVMRDPSVLEPDIRTYLEAENAHTDAVMVDTTDLQERLFAELKGRIKEDDSTPPAPDGDYAYFTDYVTGGQHPRFLRQPREGGEATVLLDGDALAKDKAYFELGGVSHSPDHKLLAWGADDRGSEYFRLRVLDIDAGSDYDDVIEDTSGGGVWAADSEHLFYTRRDENHRPSRVFVHRLGTEPEEDRLVYEETDPGFFVSVGKTQSGEWLVISTHDHETAELYLIDARDPLAEPRCVAPREKGHEYDVDHEGERLFILTNRDGAEDFKIVSAPLDDPSPEHWTDVVPHVEGRLIHAIIAFKGRLVRLERESGLPRIVITDLASAEEHAIAFDEEAYSLGLGGGYEFDTDTLRFTYSSMTTPMQVFDYDMGTRTRTLLKTQEVPSGHDPDNYVTRRLHAPTADGELVPISLLYAKSTPLDGSAPVLLYGYGSYGISMPAAFSTNRLSLVDRGFIYAIAHIRGGKDKGYRWYKLGKREHKTNTFSDFIAAGEYLVGQGLTRRGAIVAHGGSAGGMLMGVVANRAPDLFRGIVAEVPFVDVLTTMLDDTLPLTPPEWPEWGNPIASETDYDAIAAYSPYDNVTAQDYPHILALAGLTDPRVTYWEPAKWVARLRERKTDDNLLLLKTNMDAGHGGAAGRFDRLKEVALVYAFALKITDRAD